MDKQSEPLTSKDLNRMCGIIKSKLANIKKFIDSSKRIMYENQIVISAGQKLSNVKLIKQELMTLFNQCLEIEDEKASKESDEEMLALQEDRDEIEVSLKGLLSTYNANEIEIIENKSNKISDLKSYIDHIELKSKVSEIPLPIFYGKIKEFSNFKNQFTTLTTDNKELKARLKNMVRFLAKLGNCANHPKSRQISAILDGFKMAAILMTAMAKNVNST
ncbi:hypothetical protein AVEN_60024-1 [Araneus ventricosus]|uniref:Uncharacterized protein n=1 Tax=Araneus ventricosus TaxID=182803 RepID=A0A4Y2CBK9_ARAVE|nr:hypothetical protein AVEN_60024-1 [Araneus ventricosus]